MIQTVEAVVDSEGRVRLLGAVKVVGVRRALVTILDEPSISAAGDCALLSEEAFSDWNRPEEDAAWAYLQTEK